MEIFFSNKSRENSNTLTFAKLMIFMQQMQYNAPNRKYVFRKFSGGETHGPPFGAGTQNRAPPLQNRGCEPVLLCIYLVAVNRVKSVYNFKNN